MPGRKRKTTKRRISARKTAGRRSPSKKRKSAKHTCNVIKVRALKRLKEMVK